MSTKKTDAEKDVVKDEEGNKSRRITLLRSAIVDGVRRPRGWQGTIDEHVTLPDDYYTSNSDSKIARPNKPKK